jgi:phage terminase large subunit-like protein
MALTTRSRRSYAAAAERYAASVAAGKRVAGSAEVAAVRRFLADLERRRSPWVWDRQRVEMVCRAIEAFPHVSGAWAARGERLVLSPWQVFLVANLFGWIERRSGLRRYRQAYISVARKNGKTTLAAALMLYMLGLDGEAGAEVYSAATTREQASICWRIARQMAMRCPEYRLATGVRCGAYVLQSDTLNARCQALSSDAHTLDGLSVHCAILDELHAHKTRDVYDVIMTATGARLQPMIIGISTAGSDRAGICWELDRYAIDVLGEKIRDDRFFAMIFRPDGEDFQDRVAWQKANPNLGVSIFEADIARKAQLAAVSPSNLAAFRVKHLNEWVATHSAWMDMHAWDSCASAVDWEEFRGKPAIMAMDLASKRDVCVLALLFKRDGKYYVKEHYFLPESALQHGVNATAYRGWYERGLITVTPGNVTDFGVVEQVAKSLAETYDVRVVVYDPYQATQLVTELEQYGLYCVELGATVKNFSEPMKQLEALVLSGQLVHDGDPVLAWMASNVVAHRDAKDNIFPRKEHHDAKIDGIVALIMALAWDARDPDWDAPARGGYAEIDPEEAISRWVS